MPRTFRDFDTKLVHAGEPDPPIMDAVNVPIFQSAMYHTVKDEGYHDIKYIRLNNTPNHDALAGKLAALENAEAALVTGSGMAAISTSLLTVLNSGDHFLVQDCVYGGTHTLITQDLPGLGISHDFIDGADPSSWESKLKPNTKAIYVESISNPLMGVPDLDAVVAFARANKLVSLIDNTFTSPANYRPIDHGFDISLHSATKYLNGHNDIVAGAVIASGEMVERIRHKLNHLGGTLDPHACFLLHRGLKTLGLRVRHQSATALSIARFLEEHPAVARVNYPGLASSPEHGRAAKFFDGFGGMLSFEVAGGGAAAAAALKRVQLPRVAPSLGGVDSLLTRPAATSHRGLSPEERKHLGISDGLVRMSVGIESVDELIDDLRQALEG